MRLSLTAHNSRLEEETVKVSDELDLLWGWGWLVDLPPWWVFLFMLLLSSVMVKFVLRPLEAGRILRGGDEFMGFRLQVFLAPAMALASELLRAGSFESGGSHTFTNWLALILACSLVAWGVWRRRAFYSRKQLLSATKLYELAFMVFVIYALLRIGLTALVYGPWGFGMVVLRLVMLACVAMWLLGLWWDRKHHEDLVDDEKYADDERRTRYWYAYAENPWRRKEYDLGYWWRRYLSDWRLAPMYLWQQLSNLKSYFHL